MTGLDAIESSPFPTSQPFTAVSKYE